MCKGLLILLAAMMLCPGEAMSQMPLYDNVEGLPSYDSMPSGMWEDANNGIYQFGINGDGPSEYSLLPLTALGTFLGMSLGFGVGYIINSDSGESWVPVTTEMMVGGIVGSTVGAPIGAYLSNNRHGDVALSLGAAALASVAAVLIAEKAPLQAAVGLPVAHMTFSILVIRLTD